MQEETIHAPSLSDWCKVTPISGPGGSLTLMIFGDVNDDDDDMR